MHKKNKGKSNLGVLLNENRIFIFLIIVVVVMSFSTSGFWSEGNIVPLLKTSVLIIMVGIGFTYVMIGGNFDLSVGSIINVGACISIGTFNYFYERLGGYEGKPGAVGLGWAIGFIAAIAAGCLVGLINGLLVAKGKVHSFIVTIGMKTALAGFVYTYCKGNTISAVDFTLVNKIEEPLIHIPYLSVFSVRFLIMIICVVFFEILLQKTKWGRNFFMVGSNHEVAWQAGINTERDVILSFVVSGFTCSLAGALFAISMNAAVPNYGERGIAPLSLALAATIIGGTTMTGGRGSVVKTAVAVVTIQAVFNGLINLGLGFDAQVFAAGILLAGVVLFEAYSLYRQNLKVGQRAYMMEEALRMRRQHLVRKKS